MRVSNLIVMMGVVLALAACGDEQSEPQDTHAHHEMADSGDQIKPSASGAPAGPVAVHGAWARLNPIPGRPAAVFFQAMSQSDDELIGAETPVAERAELHTHEHSDGVMRMLKVESFAVKSGEALEFKSGSHHVMLFGVGETLAKETSFPMTLIFRDAGNIVVTVAVGDPAR